MNRTALAEFLSYYPSFGGWREEWLGAPLDFRACLAAELPPPEFVGSVRGIVLRDNEVLVIHSTEPILSVGGRRESGESIEQTLLREIAEETGWVVRPLGVIGFIHCRHLDDQRPAWGRPAPDFIDPLYAVVAERFDAWLMDETDIRREFVSLNEVDVLGLEEINLTFLRAALRLHSGRM